MQNDSDPGDESDSIVESTRESLRKARDLVDELKTIEEHEKEVLGEENAPPRTTHDEDPPLFNPSR